MMEDEVRWERDINRLIEEGKHKEAEKYIRAVYDVPDPKSLKPEKYNGVTIKFNKFPNFVLANWIINGDTYGTHAPTKKEAFGKAKDIIDENKHPKRERINDIINALNKKDFDYIFDNYETEFVYGHEPVNYKEIWKKDSATFHDSRYPLDTYWYHLYEYKEGYRRPHLLFINGRTGNTKELKIYL